MSDRLADALNEMCAREQSFQIEYVACTPIVVSVGDNLNGFTAHQSFQDAEQIAAFLRQLTQATQADTCSQ